MTRRIVAVASGGGSVLGTAVGADELVRSQVVSLVTDRPCGAEAVAGAHGFPVVRIDEPDNRLFSDALLAHCEALGADHVVLFFSRLLAGDVLDRYRDRIVNLHPSLLPAFKGFDALGQARRAGVRFTGTTVHFIDEQADEGRIVLQSVLPVDPDDDPVVLRHRQFEQLCKGLIQTCHWLEQDRIHVEGGTVRVDGARFDQPDFAPGLEAASALRLRVPLPVKA